ncbi:hypothetical protein BJV74DRAFT_795280 [Russula compacta]|nr:hypothetical protein BJV74DRAFT_795280 [Russula compacta]
MVLVHQMVVLVLLVLLVAASKIHKCWQGCSYACTRVLGQDYLLLEPTNPHKLKVLPGACQPKKMNTGNGMASILPTSQSQKVHQLNADANFIITKASDSTQECNAQLEDIEGSFHHHYLSHHAIHITLRIIVVSADNTCTSVVTHTTLSHLENNSGHRDTTSRSRY